MPNTYEYRVDGGEPISLPASPVELTGLTAGTEYTIEVRAVSPQGVPGLWYSTAVTTTGGAWTPDNLTGMTDTLAAFFADPIVSGYKDATPSDTPSDKAGTGDLVSTLLNESQVTSVIKRLSQAVSGSRPTLLANGNLSRPSGSGIRALFTNFTTGNSKTFTIACWIFHPSGGATSSIYSILGGDTRPSLFPLSDYRLGTNTSGLGTSYPFATNPKIKVDGSACIFTSNESGWQAYIDGDLIASGGVLPSVQGLNTFSHNFFSTNAEIGRSFLAHEYHVDSADISNLTKWLKREL